MQQVRKSLLFLALATMILSLLAAISLTSIRVAQAKGVGDNIVGDELEITECEQSLDDWSTLTYDKGDSPRVLDEPTRPGHHFEGWFTDPDYTNRVTELDGESSGILYAKWAEKTLAETYNAQANRYDITTFSQLNSLREWVSYNPIYKDYTFDANVYLLNDIEFSGTWEPIPARLIGFFEGNNHSLNGMKISISAPGEYGLFKSIEQQGTIQNLKFKNVNITNSKTDNSRTTYVGTVAGLSLGTITNCSVESGKISAKLYDSYVGGIVGFCRMGEVVSCTTSSSVDVTGRGYVGGIVGSTSSAEIRLCTNNATVSYSYNTQNGCAAGIVGKATNTDIVVCTNRGKIKYTGLLNLSKDISPCMAQIVGWRVGGTLVSPVYSEKDENENYYCDFGMLRNYQTSFCSNYDVGRTGA